ncbi:hypothetical protein V6N11_043263 [Hibiscus sabdariffa]|uniref:Uncharacterized protein n=1 Tax=Hibiscus sabdariffa TaxID=183260 RepID=A0ABR2QZ07_9ROSI
MLERLDGVTCDEGISVSTVQPKDNMDLVGSDDQNRGVVALLKCTDQSPTMAIDTIRGVLEPHVGESVQLEEEPFAANTIIKLVEGDEQYEF